MRAAPQIVGASLGGAAGARCADAGRRRGGAGATGRGDTRAAQQAGWTVDVDHARRRRVGGGGARRCGRRSRSSAYALVAHDDRTDLLQIEQRPPRRRATLSRRRRADAAMIADTVGPTRAGRDPRRASRHGVSCNGALSSFGVSVLAPSGEWSSVADDAEVLAAHFAGSELGPVLRSDDRAGRRATKARTSAAWQVAACAAALFVLAAACRAMGSAPSVAGRARQSARAFARRLPSTMVGRTTVDAAYAQLAALERRSSARRRNGRRSSRRQRCGARRRVSHGDPCAR